MNDLIYVFLGVYLLTSALGALRAVYYYQLKEYRFDKFWDFLKSKSGKELLFSFPAMFRCLVFLNIAWIELPLLFLILVVFEVLMLAANASKRKIFRPDFTKKALLIFGLSFITEWLLIYLSNFDLRVAITINTFRFVLIGAFVVLFAPITLIAKMHFVKKARKKLLSMDNLIVIGITGSYGKSSVKNFLSTILAEKYEVIKTPKNTNTEIGIARLILKNLNTDHQVFVAEMGAYTRNEIGKACIAAPPNIGIVTAINEQHLELFKSIENIMKAKGELLQALPEDGLAVLNGDNNYCVEMKKYSKAEAKFYYMRDVEFVDANEDSIRFRYEGYEYTTPFGTNHFVQNLLGVIKVAKYLGLSEEEIQNGISKTELDQGSLKLIKKNGVKILDDTYNSNPDGARSSLKELKNIKAKRKIAIIYGLLELGPRTKEVHMELAEEIDNICDTCIVVSKNIEEFFKGNLKKSKYIFEDDHKRLLEIVKSEIQEGDAVLLNNKVPELVCKWLKR